LENVRIDLYILEYLFINKIFEMKNKSFNDIFKKKFFNLFYRWENVRLDLYIFEYLFINKIFVYQQNEKIYL
jgi:hypothetical protein